MQIPKGAGRKDFLRQFRGLLGRLGLRLPHHNIQLRAAAGKRLEVPELVFPQPPVQLQGRRTAASEAMGKRASRHRRQELLRGPQSHRRGTGPRTLQTDLAKVQLLGREVGVGRVVLVEASHRRVAKENASAAVGLQAVLVRINHDRIGLVDDREGLPRWGIQSLGNQPEVAAISRIHMDPEAVPLPQRQNLVQRIDCADGRGAQRHHHRAHAAFAQFVLQRLHAHASAAVSRDGRILQLQHGGDALMGVVRLLGADNALARSQLPGHPQSLQIGQRSARSQMAEKIRPAEDRGDFADSLNLHLRAGPATVASVVVGVDRHGQRVSSPRQRMGRLEHLPGIERVKEGVVVAQPERDLFQNRCHRRRIGSGLKGGQSRELLLEQLGGARQQSGNGIGWHGNLPR